MCIFRVGVGTILESYGNHNHIQGCVCALPGRLGSWKRGDFSLDGMGDRPTPEGLDHLKVPWHRSYREPFGRRGWKEAHN